jgi:hypothetical protein
MVDRSAQSWKTWYALSAVAALFSVGWAVLAARQHFPGLRWLCIALCVVFVLLAAACLWTTSHPLQVRLWPLSEEFLTWLSESCNRHVDALRLQTFTNGDGAVCGASLHSSKDIDLHLDLGWSWTCPTVSLRRGQQRVGTWVLNTGLVGGFERQMTALQEIVEAVVAGNGVLRVGRLGSPRLVLSGVNSGWSRAGVEVGVRIEGARGAELPLPAWY